MRNALHYIIMLILVAVVSALVYYGLASLGLMPMAASAQAAPIDWLFDLQMKLIAFFFALIMVPMLYSLVVFRRRKGDTSDGEHFEGHTGLEIGWTVLPLIITIWLGIVGADNLRQVQLPDRQAHEIKVIARQWDWTFEYGPGFSSSELYLPVNKQVLLKMESLDVLHSFWVVEFRIKQDVVPGRVTDYRVTPDVRGDYLIRCAELCGIQHTKMQKPVHVVTQEEYDKWFAEQLAIYEKEQADPIPNARRGEKLYTEQGCKTCHSLNGAEGTGPTWLDLYNAKVELADGTIVTADDAFLTESIREPGVKTVKGFGANAMPNFGLILKDKEIADLVAFIKTIKQ